MFWIEGTSRAGLGAATKNLGVQLPMISAEFPEVASCRHGTVNLLLDCPLLVLAPDHRTRQIPWDPSFGDGEVFDLLRIHFEAPTGTAPVLAWLYIPHGSPHRKDPRCHEVLAPNVQLSTGARCRVGISRNAVQLPYQTWPVIMVV